MATDYLDPNTTESSTWLASGSPHHAQIDEGATPDVNDYINNDASSEKGGIFGMTTLAGSYTATACSVKVYAVSPFTPTLAIDISLNGGTTWEGSKNVNVPQSTAAWVETTSWTINTSDLSNLQVKLGPNTIIATVYTMRATITYTATSSAKPWWYYQRASVRRSL